MHSFIVQICTEWLIYDRSVLGSYNIEVNKTDQNLALIEITFQQGKEAINIISKLFNAKQLLGSDKYWGADKAGQEGQRSNQFYVRWSE